MIGVCHHGKEEDDQKSKEKVPGQVTHPSFQDHQKEGEN